MLENYVLNTSNYCLVDDILAATMILKAKKLMLIKILAN